MSALTDQIVTGVYNGLVSAKDAQIAAYENAGVKSGTKAPANSTTSSQDLGTRGDFGGSTSSDQLRTNGGVSEGYSSMMGASLMGSAQFTAAEVRRGYRKIKA